MFLFGLFCAFKTLTIDLVHFYGIITAENVGTGIPLSVKNIDFLCNLRLNCMFDGKELKSDELVL